jgi:hypothetical protein
MLPIHNLMQPEIPTSISRVNLCDLSSALSCADHEDLLFRFDLVSCRCVPQPPETRAFAASATLTPLPPVAHQIVTQIRLETDKGGSSWFSKPTPKSAEFTAGKQWKKTLTQ